MPPDSYLFYKTIKSKKTAQQSQQHVTQAKPNVVATGNHEVKSNGSIQYSSLSRKHSSAYLDELEAPEKSIEHRVSRRQEMTDLVKRLVLTSNDLKRARAFLLEEITDKIFKLYTQIVISSTWNQRRQTDKRLYKIEALKALLALIGTRIEISEFDDRFVRHFRISPLIIYPEELKWQGIKTIEQLETSPHYAKAFKYAFQSNLKLTSDVKDIFLAAKEYFAYTANPLIKMDVDEEQKALPRLYRCS